MARRTMLLVGAIVVALFGTTLVAWYAHGVNQRALARQHPVSVLVAKKEIPAGTTAAAAAAAGAFASTTLAADAVAPGALSDVRAIADEVTTAPIMPGEQILAAKFAKADSTTALPIPDSASMAVSFTFSQTALVGGFVEPGSDVAVYLTTSAGTRLLIPRVEVIAVGAKTLAPVAPGQQAPAASDVVTFGVSPTQAQQLIYAQNAGSMYLALLTPTASTPSLPATNAGNVFGS